MQKKTQATTYSQRADLYLPAGFYTLQDTGTKTLMTRPGLTVWSPLIMPFCYWSFLFLRNCPCVGTNTVIRQPFLAAFFGFYFLRSSLIYSHQNMFSWWGPLHQSAPGQSDHVPMMWTYALAIHETRLDAPCFPSQPSNFIHWTLQLTSDHIPMMRRDALHVDLSHIRTCPHECTFTPNCIRPCPHWWGHNINPHQVAHGNLFVPNAYVFLYVGSKIQNAQTEKSQWHRDLQPDPHIKSDQTTSSWVGPLHQPPIRSMRPRTHNGEIQTSIMDPIGSDMRRFYTGPATWILNKEGSLCKEDTYADLQINEDGRAKHPLENSNPVLVLSLVAFWVPATLHE